MKNLILTFQSAYNFGAVLQAYALQNYIEEEFGETKILNYQPKCIIESYNIPSLKKFIKNPKHGIFKVIQAIVFKGKYKKIDEFREKFKLTEYYNEISIKNANINVDNCIVGSDQVWNYEIINNDGTFFLDFIKGANKISYAASFGNESIPLERQEWYKEQLNNINFISVREEMGAKIVKRLNERNAEVLIDPVFLLDANRWKEIIKKNNKERYVLVYKITKEVKLLEFAKKLSKLTGLKIKYVPNDLKKMISGEYYLNIGPSEWLDLIYNAEYVVTNSFHGTAFSIIFNKKFFVEAAQKANGTTSRIYNLLRMFDLEDREISNFDIDILNKLPDEEVIKKVIQKETCKSYNFLKNALSNDSEITNNEVFIQN